MQGWGGEHGRAHTVLDWGPCLHLTVQPLLAWCLLQWTFLPPCDLLQQRWMSLVLALTGMEQRSPMCCSLGRDRSLQKDSRTPWQVPAPASVRWDKQGYREPTLLCESGASAKGFFPLPSKLYLVSLDGHYEGLSRGKELKYGERLSIKSSLLLSFQKPGGQTPTIQK